MANNCSKSSVSDVTEKLDIIRTNKIKLGCGSKIPCILLLLVFGKNHRAKEIIVIDIPNAG